MAKYWQVPSLDHECVGILTELRVRATERAGAHRRIMEEASVILGVTQGLINPYGDGKFCWSISAMFITLEQRMLGLILDSLILRAQEHLDNSTEG